MVSSKEIESQLHAIKVHIRFLGRPEADELCKIILPEEKIIQCLIGFYQDTVALLCVTDKRVLVIDKRPFFLNIEDVRYEMISEVDYGGRLIDSSLTMHTLGKMFTFKSWRQSQLRSAYSVIQEMVLEVRKSPIQKMQIAATAAEVRSPLVWQRPIVKYSRPGNNN